MDKFIEILRILIGSVFVLYLPGHFLSYIFLKKGSIDIIERIGISFALSISIVPLVVFYLNLLGVKINVLSVFLEVSGIIVFSKIYIYIINNYKKKNDIKR